jgi:type IV fimbrial biogenesis protein FimT
MRRNSGFTAYELAVTLAIVAVLATVTMPSFLSWLTAHRLRGAAINLVADLEMAKIRAIRENTFVAVAFKADMEASQFNRYEIFIDNGADAGERKAGERLLVDRPLPTGVRIPLGELTLANPWVRFTSRGLPADMLNAELIPLVNPAGRRDIRLNRLGRLWTQ